MLSSTLSVVLRKCTLHLFWWPTMQGADLTIGSNFGVQCPRTLGQVDRRSRESKPSASWATLTQRRMMQPFGLFTKHGYLTSCGCKSIKRSKYAVLCRKFVKKGLDEMYPMCCLYSFGLQPYFPQFQLKSELHEADLTYTWTVTLSKSKKRKI